LSYETTLIVKAPPAQTASAEYWQVKTNQLLVPRSGLRFSESLDLKRTSCQVLLKSGHTWCSISQWFYIFSVTIESFYKVTQKIKWDLRALITIHP